MAARTTGGSGNWSSTTPNAPWTDGTVPIEGDTVIIASGHTVTIDQNITVGNDSSTAAIDVAEGGKLEVLSTVAGDYTLTCKGEFKVSGTLEIGTTSNPIPNTRTFTIKLNYSASLDVAKYGMQWGVSAGATITIQGASKTYYTCLLAADASVGATSITTSVSTGWKDNDELGLAPTTRINTQYEKLVMNGDASGTTINFDSPASLAYAHDGDSPTQAEIINLTRNIVITSYDSSYQGYIQVGANAGTVVDVDWVRFSYLGSNTSAKYGVSFTGSALSTAADFRYCSFTNCYNAMYSSIENQKFNLYHCVMYLGVGHAIYITATMAECTLQNIYIIGISGSSQYGIYLVSSGVTSGDWSYIHISGSAGYGLGITTNTTSMRLPTCSYLNIHTNSSYSVALNSITGLTIDNSKIWRAGNIGIRLSDVTGTLITNTDFRGNANEHISFISSTEISVRGCTFNGESVYTVPYGIISSFGCSAVIENSTFGSTVTHTTGDVRIDANVSGGMVLKLVKCTLSSSSTIYQPYNSTKYMRVYEHDIGGTEGNHKTWKREGTIVPDSSVYKTASPSEKITPYYAAEKMESFPRYITCGDGLTRTVKVWVRKSSAYDGDQPRLILKRNYAAGVTSDTVLDTMTAAVETWEQLSGVVTAPSEDTVYELVVDCAGANSDTKYINVDDWTVE